MSLISDPLKVRSRPMLQRSVHRVTLQTFVAVGLTISAGGNLSAADCPTTTGHQQLSRFVFRQTQMGTLVRIVLYAGDKTTANEAAESAYIRIAELNRVLSDYDSQSEAMRLCRSTSAAQGVQVSRDLAHVLRSAREVSRRSDGAFDVTIGPVTKLWRRARRQKRLPPASLLAAALTKVDYRLVNIEAQTVRLRSDGMQLDFGGIGKGYAADAALQVIRNRGITRALVDAGGDIVVGQPPPGEPGWRIGIGPAQRPNAQPRQFIRLSCAAVATSGDAYQYVEIDSVRYSHIVDPRTGLGLTTPSSITVIAHNGINADAWASALSVLPPQRGMALIESLPRSAALIVRSVDGKLESIASTRLRKFVVH
jgi:thiamine biosynthesis lipoprotein